MRTTIRIGNRGFELDINEIQWDRYERDLVHLTLWWKLPKARRSWRVSITLDGTNRTITYRTNHNGVWGGWRMRGPIERLPS